MIGMRTDLSTWVVGPYHGSLPGPMRLALDLDGEVISSAEVESGFLHRGLEKAFERQPWFSTVPYADRLDPENAISGELAFCLAVEEIGQIPVPERSRAIRIIAAELGRVCSHLGYVLRVARATGAETMFHYASRDREKVLDLFELLTGARFSFNFLRFGGVVADVTEGFVERVLESCDLLRVRLKEYNDLLTFNHAFLRRTREVGALDRQAAKKWGVTGPNARASGIELDVRRFHPYSGYDHVDFQVSAGTGADCHERFLVRLREVSQSLEILKQALEYLPGGPFLEKGVDREFSLKKGEAYSRVESARGLLGCHVVSDGGLRPARVQFRTPSTAVLSALPDVLAGQRLEDLPVVLASLDIGVAEADR